MVAHTVVAVLRVHAKIEERSFQKGADFYTPPACLHEKIQTAIEIPLHDNVFSSMKK